MAEAVAGILSYLPDPWLLGAILAVVFLVVLYSIVSSLRRLQRRIDAVASSLSAIRATLASMERFPGKPAEKGTWSDGEEAKDIWRTVFRADDGSDRR